MSPVSACEEMHRVSARLFPHRRVVTRGIEQHVMEQILGHRLVADETAQVPNRRRS